MRKPTAADFERSIPIDLDDSDWEFRSFLARAFFPDNHHANKERAAEDEREIRTGRLMR